MSSCLNRVVIVGNLTRDPELRATAGGTAVCSLRVAVNERIKDRTSSEWTDAANYFNVTAFAGLAELCAKYLGKGRQVAVDGRLRWREWQTKDGQKREAVEIIAETVQFLGAQAMSTAAVKPAAVDPEDADIPF